MLRAQMEVQHVEVLNAAMQKSGNGNVCSSTGRAPVHIELKMASEGTAAPEAQQH